MDNMRVQRVCIISAIVAILLFFASFVTAGFLPPPSPSLSVTEVGLDRDDMVFIVACLRRWENDGTWERARAS